MFALITRIEDRVKITIPEYEYSRREWIPNIPSKYSKQNDKSHSELLKMEGVISKDFIL